jgi:UPF0716 protein FxsA
MRLRHGWPLFLLIVLLVAVPIFEVWLLIKVGQQLGLLPTVLILIGEAILGVLLMRHEGARAWKALNDAFTQGKVPTGELADAALILVGGVLLMLPGFLTDVLGFLFLLRWTRPVARKIIAFFVARRVNRLGIPVMRARLDTENLIEGESVEQPPANGRKREGPVIIAGEIEETLDKGGNFIVRRAAVRGTSTDEKAAHVLGSCSCDADARSLIQLSLGPLGRFLRPGGSRESGGPKLARTQQAQPFCQQCFQLGDGAPLAEHVPMRTLRLLFLQLGTLTVGAQRLRAAPRALPH